MRIPKVFGARLAQPQTSVSLSKYKVGQRTVELLQLTDGHIHWVCNCEDYTTSAASPRGAWCKHVAKASAIRSIERLTGARVIVHPASLPVRAAERAASERNGEAGVQSSRLGATGATPALH